MKVFSANGTVAMVDAVDRALVKATQQGLPLDERPYHRIAEALGIAPEAVIRRLHKLLDAGIIRRIGVVPNHFALGLSANGMTVWDVDDDAVAQLGPQVGALDFVSHCYRRPRLLPHWPYNLFAMVHGADRDEVAAKIDEIARLLAPHCRAHEVLYSKRILKKTGLRLVG
jgi:DNA-binding Lrp family transcriptional regulator